MKRYYNAEENRVYYEGRSITRHLPDGRLFAGIPTEEQLKEWGFLLQEPQLPPEPTEEEQAERARLTRMAEIKSILAELDYLTHKEADGEDMSAYDEKYGGDWHAYRRGLREEYNELESQTSKQSEL